MINIAIVDDMASECKILCCQLKQYEAQLKHPIQITEFHSCAEFFRDYIQGRFDIIFLDIYLDNENGVDCARELRKIDDEVNLIFLTTSSEFGIKSYDVRAVDYIVKPATLDNISRAFNYCKIAQLQEEPSIQVTTRNQPLEITVDHILYADVQNRTTCIHLNDCLIPISGGLSELSEQLESYPQFMSCFKGIIVNLKEIREVSKESIVLVNGENLPVSRRLLRHVQLKRLSLSAGSLRGNI